MNKHLDEMGLRLCEILEEREESVRVIVDSEEDCYRALWAETYRVQMERQMRE
jgi:Trk K+ transport system NAD-binding subunit